MSAEAFGALPPDVIAGRTILDPMTPDTAIDWRNHIRLDIADAASRTAVVNALDRLAALPQGRQLLRQAVLNQQARAAQSGVPAQLCIIAGAKNEFRENNGTITFSLEETVGNTYPTANGPAPFDAMHVLVHELFHAADGMNTAHYKQLMHDQGARFASASGVNSDDGFAMFIFRMGAQQALYMENPTIAATNHFIGTHFNQPARLPIDPAADTSVVVPDLSHRGTNRQLMR